MAEHRQGKPHNRCHTDDHVYVHAHVYEEEEGQSGGKGLDVIVVCIFGGNVQQI